MKVIMTVVLALALVASVRANDCDDREYGGCTTTTTLPDPPAACPSVCPTYTAPSYVRCVWDKDHDTVKCSKRVVFVPKD